MIRKFSQKNPVSIIGVVVLLVAAAFFVGRVFLGNHSDKIIFEATFDVPPVFEGKMKPSGNDLCKVVETLPAGNSPALRCSLNRIKDDNPYRSELVPVGMSGKYFKKGKNARLGKTYWYALRVYIPPDWQFDDDLEVLMQWHAYPDFKKGETWRNPPLSLRVGGGKAGPGKSYRLLVFGDHKEVTPANGVENRYDFAANYDLGSIEADVGVWRTWVFRITWASDKEGSINIWKDGKEIFKLAGQPTAFNDEFGPFFKFGLYKISWKNRQGAPGLEERIIYYDDIRIGSGRAAFEDVISPQTNK